MRGSPRHSESNGGVERVNQTVQKKLGSWMKDNKTKRWSIGCKIIQWRYNTQVHRSLGNQTPYWCTYGQQPRVGISNLPLDPVLLDSLATEGDLNRVFDSELDFARQRTATQPASDDESNDHDEDVDEIEEGDKEKAAPIDLVRPICPIPHCGQWGDVVHNLLGE